MEFIRFRFTNFQNRIAAVLEGETESSTPKFADANLTQENLPFKTDNDFTKFSAILNSLGTSAGLRSQSDLFLSLHRCFEAGFLLSQTNGQWPELESMFLAGQTYHFSKSDRRPIQFQVPKNLRSNVMRGRMRAVFQTFQMPVPDTLSKDGASAFLFSPIPGKTVILICNRAPLWQIDAIEEAYRFLLEGFSYLNDKNRRPISARWFGWS